MNERQPAFTGEEAAVMKVIEDETVAFYNKDFEAWARCWVQAPYIRRLGWWTRGGVVDRTGWKEVGGRAHTNMLDHPEPNATATLVRRENVVVRVSKDMAWATFDEYGPEAGEPDIDMPGLSREARFLEKHDGQWRIAFHCFVHQAAEQTYSAMLRVDASGNVSWMNKAATANIEDADHLVVHHGRLRATSSSANIRLQQAIGLAAAADGEKLFGARAAMPIVLDSASGEEAIVCWVISEGSGSGAVIVSINNVHFAQDRLAAAAQLYGLSATQQRVIEQILAGYDLTQCAAFLGVSVNTVRTHLQRIFDKTGTRTQPQLVRTLLSVTAPVE